MEDSKRRELALKWREAKHAAWEKFIEENIGMVQIKDNGLRPGCYGSGDGYFWCDDCIHQPTC